MWMSWNASSTTSSKIRSEQDLSPRHRIGSSHRPTSVRLGILLSDNRCFVGQICNLPRHQEADYKSAPRLDKRLVGQISNLPRHREADYKSAPRLGKRLVGQICNLPR